MADPLRDLNDAQRQVVQTTHGPVLVLAGAGSGKTRALTHRIAYIIQNRIAPASEVMAMTFTNKAAGEMKERIRHLINNPKNTPRAIGTFHSLGARMLREASAYHSHSPHFIILDEKDKLHLIRQACRDHSLSLRDWNPHALAHRISVAKNNLLQPEVMAAEAEGLAANVAAQVYQRYEALLARHNAYDFDDLLRLPVLLMEGNPDLRAKFQRRWRWLSVDEYQDTNPLQISLLKLLLGPEQNICVVGDDYQSIYSWRGAKVDHILNFEAEFPGCQTIYLTQNYRSTPQILQAANTVIAGNRQQKHKKLWTSNKGGQPVQIVALPSDRFEARWVRQHIEDHVRAGGSLRDCVVLYRTNAQSRLFEEEFLTQRLPYTIVGGYRFYDRREVKDALAFLHLWLNPNARLSLERIAAAMLRGIGPKTLDRWEAQASTQGISLRDVLAQHSAHPQLQRIALAYANTGGKKYEHVSHLLQDLLQDSRYVDHLKTAPDGEERVENIKELFSVAAAYIDVPAFLEDVSLLSEIDTYEEQRDRVTCMTLHAAKGLEFAVVCVVGCEEGLLPHINSYNSLAALEEERRLLYVGMTRARQQLTVTWAQQRYLAGEITPQLPSRFFDQLPEGVDCLLAAAAAPEDLPIIEYDLPRFNIR